MFKELKNVFAGTCSLFFKIFPSCRDLCSMPVFTHINWPGTHPVGQTVQAEPQGFTSLCFPSAGITGGHHSTWLFFFWHRFWGMEWRSSCTLGKHFTDWAIRPTQFVFQKAYVILSSIGNVWEYNFYHNILCAFFIKWKTLPVRLNILIVSLKSLICFWLVIVHVIACKFVGT